MNDTKESIKQAIVLQYYAMLAKLPDKEKAEYLMLNALPDWDKLVEEFLVRAKSAAVRITQA